jgi:hypothetical protein
MTVLLQADRLLLDQNWFDEDAAEAVIMATGLPTQNGFDLASIAAALTRITNHSVSDQLSKLRSAIEWNKALGHARAAIAYNDFALAWSAAGENMMRLSNDQLYSLRHFEEFADKQVSSKARRRMKAWTDTFYIDVLGLFCAVFETEPSSYVSDSDKSQAHQTVFFIKNILEHINEVQTRCCYSARIFPTSNERADWGLHDAGTIGAHIAKYKKVILISENRPHWQERRDEFLSIL